MVKHVKSDRAGWDVVPAAERWTCPECDETSSVDDWVECEVNCELCGSHEARRCPHCDEVFDHVYGSGLIRERMLRGAQDTLYDDAR